MEFITTFTLSRFTAIEEFGRLQGQAQLDHMHHWFTANPDRLEDFASLRPFLPGGRRYRGLKEVPVEKITGSVDRTADFDRIFRPLKKHLRDRWVNVSLLAESGAWAPIIVYMVGDRYFVEDGHHRVSVARARGMVSIPAEVWEYPLFSVPVDQPSPETEYCRLPCAESNVSQTW